MRILGVRFDSIPVVKVLLGGETVWEIRRDLRFYGEVVSGVLATARFYVPVIYGMAGQADSSLDSDTKLHVIQIEMLTASADSKSHTQLAAKLIKVLTMATKLEMVSATKANANVLDVMLLNSNAESHSYDKSAAILTQVIPAESWTQSFSMDKSESVLVAVLPVSAHDPTTVPTSFAEGHALYKRDISGNEKQQVNTYKATLYAVSEAEMAALADSFSYDWGATVVNDAHLARGAIEIMGDAITFARLGDVLGLGGNAFSDIFSIASAVLNDAELLSGNGDADTDSIGHIKKYKAFFCKAREVVTTTAGGGLIIWFPPVGDGQPLVAEDGVDITRNGEVLEIKQAFRVRNYDEQTLEVI